MSRTGIFKRSLFLFFVIVTKWAELLNLGERKKNNFVLKVIISLFDHPYLLYLCISTHIYIYVFQHIMYVTIKMLLEWLSEQMIHDKYIGKSWQVKQNVHSTLLCTKLEHWWCHHCCMIQRRHIWCWILSMLNIMLNIYLLKNWKKKDIIIIIRMFRIIFIIINE